MKTNDKLKIRKILLVIIATIAFTTTSLAILTHAQCNKYELNKMQQSFFSIVTYMESNEDILVEEMRSFNKNLKLEKTEQLGKDNMADIYIVNNDELKTNEEIKIYYEKRNGKEPYYARNVEYNIKNKVSDVTLIRLAHVNIFKDKKSILFELGTPSLKELDNNTRVLNFKSADSELFKVYSSLLKEIELDKDFTTKDLMSINSNFVDTGDNIFTMSSDDNEIIVGFNKSNGQVSYVTFYDISEDKFNRQYINTKTKNLEYKDWDVQKYYETEYCFDKEGIGHIITMNNDDVEEAKNNFIDFMREYNNHLIKNK